MWLIGDWGQPSPWSRTTGIPMVKGKDGVYVGELSLPKGTGFDIRTLKSTVSTTSGGDNVRSAVRYASILNSSSSYDFGEFTDNLIPNGSFDEGQVKWTPSGSIIEGKYADSQPYLLASSGVKCYSDPFNMPANQQLEFSGRILSYSGRGTATITVESVDPQPLVLHRFAPAYGDANKWSRFSETFRSVDFATKCRIVIETTGPGALKFGFDTLSLMAP